MPRRIVKHSREDPARAILMLIASMSLLSQIWATFLTIPWWHGLPNLVIVAPFALWGMFASMRGKLKHMSLSSFWLACVWIWTSLTRLLLTEGIGELLWIPFLILGLTLGVTYLHFSFRARVSKAVERKAA